MSERTTIDLPDEVYDALCRKAAEEHTSIRSLVLEAISSRYQTRKKGKRVTSHPVPDKSKPGPQCPDRRTLTTWYLADLNVPRTVFFGCSLRAA